MDYQQTTFRIDCNPDNDFIKDLLTSDLAEIGFDSFEETGRGIIAYCPAHLFNENTLTGILSYYEHEYSAKIAYRNQIIEDQNWNAIWEQNSFEPITIDDKCIIHASDKTVTTNYDYDIIINPVQSFGSGYHQTTQLILSRILQLDFTNCHILDIGCGTAVLSILAAKRNASKITAIDIDKWAWQNAKDNLHANGIENAEVLLGNASILASYNNQFDYVFANINRNILLTDMPQYATAMKSNATLIISGFYISDLETLCEAAQNCGLKYKSHVMSADEWTMAEFTKPF